MAMTRPKSSQVEHRGETVQKVIDDITQEDGVLVADPSWTGVPRLKGANANKQAQALANRTELIRGATLRYQDYASALSAASRLADGQTISCISPEGRAAEYVVQAGSLVFKRFISSFIEPGDSASLQDAMEKAASLGESLVIHPGVHEVNSLSAACNLKMEPGSVLKFNGPNNGLILTITGNNLNIPYLCLDAGGENCAQLLITGNGNSIGCVEVRNGVASPSGSSSLYGVAFTGDGNSIDRILLKNFKNTGYSNESFPQGVVFIRGNNRVGTICADSGQSIVVAGTLSGTSKVDSITVTDISDNGIYQLGGHLDVGSLTYINNSATIGTEVAVFAGGTADIKEISVVGAANAIGFQNTSGVNIGSVHISENASGRSMSSIFRTRAANVNSGVIKIGSVLGRMRSANSLWLFNTGTIESFSIESFDIEYKYTGEGVLTSWAGLQACKGFSIRYFGVNITDETSSLTSADNFWLRAPSTNLSKESLLGKCHVTIYKADGSSSPAGFRGADFCDQKIHIGSAEISTNVGPYILKSSSMYCSDKLYVNAMPSLGDWRIGTVVWNRTPVPGGALGWVCTTAGSSSVWKVFGSIAT